MSFNDTLPDMGSQFDGDEFRVLFALGEEAKSVGVLADELGLELVRVVALMRGLRSRGFVRLAKLDGTWRWQLVEEQFKLG